MSNLRAPLGITGLTDIGYQFLDATGALLGSRSTAGVYELAGSKGVYGINNPTFPSGATDVYWNSTGTAAAYAYETFDFRMPLSAAANADGGLPILSVSGTTLAYTVTTLSSLPAAPTDWLTAAAVKADAVTKIQSGLSTYAGGDTTGTTTLLTRITGAVALASALPANFSILGINASGHLSRVTLVDTNTDMRGTDSAALAATALSTAVWTGTIAGRIDQAISAAGTLTSGERTAIANEVEAQIIDETDSEKVLAAITDKIASVNPSLGSLTVAAIASAVWTSGARVLTAGTNIVLAKGTGVTGFNDLSAAQVNAEADTALADAGLTPTITGRLDVALSTLGTAASLAAVATEVGKIPRTGQTHTYTNTATVEAATVAIT